jgi:murein L,D-transpeptidase YcbB/YkuD
MYFKKKTLNFTIACWLVVTLGLSNLLSADEKLSFHESASDIVMHSLEVQPDKVFLKKLYRQLFFVPVWITQEDTSPLAKSLFSHMKSDKILKKESRLYKDMMALEIYATELYGSDASLVQKVDLEFKISQLYKGYADYTLYGSINWGAFQSSLYNLKAKSINAAWETYKPRINAISLLENAALGANLDQLFKDAMPKEYHYEALYNMLIKYIEMQENSEWKPVLLTGSLRIGKAYEVVPALRERLRLLGDYHTCSESTEGLIYNTCLRDALVHFKKRHGLVPSVKISKQTISALNIAIETKIAKIRLNLDRIKWLNQRNAERHIMINIPAFTLNFEENGQLRQQMRVVTGKPKNPTPIFSNMVQTIVLNPYWNIPKSIIQKEMIPKLMRNPNAMARKGIEIHSGWGKGAQKISGASIDWSQYRYSKSVPFRFAQVPGTRNALGKVKFLFPNRYSVYMHDTPSKSLFKRNVRAFSHGCIRLQKPRELLRTFSTFNENVDFSKSQNILKGKKRTYLSLTSKVPVDVVYLTAWVDYNGVLQFRDDIYGYDRMQLEAFRQW